MTHHSDQDLQRLWDTYLLHFWRNAGTIMDAMYEFHRVTGKHISECSLLRVPPPGYPWKITMRVFLADRLEKIGNRMWDMPKERDQALIDKLQTSKYDTANQSLNPDRELQKERRDNRKNVAKMKLEAKNYGNRNRKTDWDVVK